MHVDTTPYHPPTHPTESDLPHKRRQLTKLVLLALNTVHQVLPTTYGMTGQQMADKLAYMAGNHPDVRWWWVGWHYGARVHVVFGL